MKEYLINGKKYRLNIFEKVETQDIAYLLGYLCGDGGYNKETHKRNARLFVSSCNENIIQHFQQTFCPDNVINEKFPVNNTKGYNINANYMSYTLNFSSKFSPTFKKFGVLALKQDRGIVGIPKKMFPFYLLGLFDADGHFSWGRRKDRNRLWGSFVITHSSIYVLNYVQSILCDELNISSTVSIKGKEKCYVLRMGKLQSLKILYNYIYDEVNTKYDIKKQKNWEQFIRELNI